MLLSNKCLNCKHGGPSQKISITSTVVIKWLSSIYIQTNLVSDVGFDDGKTQKEHQSTPCHHQNVCADNNCNLDLLAKERP